MNQKENEKAQKLYLLMLLKGILDEEDFNKLWIKYNLEK